MMTSIRVMVMIVNKLRTELNKILKSIHPNITVDGKSKSRVYFEDAPDTVPFPYIVYNLPQSFTIDDQENFNLDIDVWDNNEITTALETLSQSIWDELNRYYHIDENMQFTTYRINRMTIQDDDPRIRRRTLMFNIRYYDRSVS